MDGTPIPTIEIAQNKAYTALFGVSTQDFFSFIQGDPSLLAGIPTLARVAAWGGGFPIKVDGEVGRRDRGERGAYGAERHRLRASSSSARTRCGFQESEMKRTTPAENKTLVIEAFDTLFNKREPWFLLSDR